VDHFDVHRIVKMYEEYYLECMERTAARRSAGTQ
jgi:hypothetical protein